MLTGFNPETCICQAKSNLFLIKQHNNLVMHPASTHLLPMVAPAAVSNAHVVVYVVAVDMDTILYRLNASV
jgi:hypothetical protein